MKRMSATTVIARPRRRSSDALDVEGRRRDHGDVHADPLQQIQRIPVENAMLLENELSAAGDERDDHPHAALPEQHLRVDVGSRLASGVQSDTGEATRRHGLANLLMCKRLRAREPPRGKLRSAKDLSLLTSAGEVSHRSTHAVMANGAWRMAGM